jgi:hypothetical protein
MKTLGDHFRLSCGTKVRHPDQLSAYREALRMTRLEMSPMNAYHCRCCGGWHVGRTGYRGKRWGNHEQLFPRRSSGR